MKNYKILLVMILLFIGLLSKCEKDFLDVTNPNQPTEAQFWNTEDDALKAITAAYGGTQMQVWWGAWGAAETWFVTQHVKSDLAGYEPGIGGTFRAAYEFEAPNTKYWISDYWSSMYQGIYATNQVMENITKMDIDDSKKKEFIAEAKYLRAYFHFHLLTNFKDIPLITKTPVNREDYYNSPVERSVVWQQIEQDFREASVDLPEKWSNDYLGRATKGAALGFLGKALLYQEKWNEAATELQKVINSGNYSLVNDIESLFNGTNEHSAESVFEINYSRSTEGGRTETNSFPPQLTTEGWLTIYANDFTRNLYENDTTADGNISTRALASIVFNHPESDAWYLPATADDGKTKYETYYGDDATRAYWKKYSYYDQGDKAIWQSGINYLVLRYSDILLMLAEAQNEQGNSSEAINIINQVRDRSNAMQISGLSQTELRDHIRHSERPLELGGEYMRFHDLVRWYKNDINGLKQVLRDHGRNTGADNFDQDDLYYPVPETEINANPNY